jgi:hypothetical protein
VSQALLASPAPALLNTLVHLFHSSAQVIRPEAHPLRQLPGCGAQRVASSAWPRAARGARSGTRRRQHWGENGACPAEKAGLSARHVISKGGSLKPRRRECLEGSIKTRHVYCRVGGAAMKCDNCNEPVLTSRVGGGRAATSSSSPTRAPPAPRAQRKARPRVMCMCSWRKIEDKQGAERRLVRARTGGGAGEGE